MRASDARMCCGLLAAHLPTKIVAKIDRNSDLETRMKGNANPTESWTVRHFSQANARGGESENVPLLLRNVADSIERLGSVVVQDLVLHNEVTAEGNWYSITVYFSTAV